MSRPQFKWQHIAPPGINREPLNVPPEPNPVLRWQMIRIAKQQLFRDGEDLMQLALRNEEPINANWQRFGTTGIVVYWMFGVATAAVFVYLTGNDDDKQACDHVLNQLTGIVHPAVLEQYRQGLGSAPRPFIYTIHLHPGTFDNPVVGEWAVAIGMAFYGSLGLDGSDPLEPAPEGPPADAGQG